VGFLVFLWWRVQLTVSASIHDVRSGNFLFTATPSSKVASKPGSPDAVRMGMRWRRDSRAVKGGGRVEGGWERGRKPLGREVVKGG